MWMNQNVLHPKQDFHIQPFQWWELQIKCVFQLFENSNDVCGYHTRYYISMWNSYCFQSPKLAIDSSSSFNYLVVQFSFRIVSYMVFFYQPLHYHKLLYFTNNFFNLQVEQRVSCFPQNLAMKLKQNLGHLKI